MPTKGQFTDADIAQPAGGQGGVAAPKTVDPSLGEMIGTTAKAGLKLGSDALQGIGAGAMQTANNIGKHIFPDSLVRKVGMTPPTEEQTRPLFQANNGPQKLFKGAEQTAEFMAPGDAEASLVSKVPEMMRPLAKIGTSALSSGAVNAAQGGSFAGGAATGGLGSAIGQGLKSLAPGLAESALGIRKGDRAFSKTPGQAIINDTTGIRPASIAESGQNKLNELTPQLEQAVNAASTRQAPRIAGFLPPPRDTVDLAAIMGKKPKSSPMAFPAEIRQGFDQRTSLPTAGAVPGALEESGTPVMGSGGRFTYGIPNPQYLSGGAHPELSGRIEQPQGTMTRTPKMSASIPPTHEPNPSTSLAPARNIASEAIGKAGRQEAGSLHGQLSDLGDFLQRGRVSGESLPENMTPSRMLDLKRGFSKEFLGRWNPDTHSDTIGTGRKIYSSMDNQIDRAVPEAAGLNQRISSLIPVVHRAESAATSPTFLQRAGSRAAARTGAMTLAGMGAMAGHSSGGVPGAIAGGLGGLLGPELLADPEAQMIMARILNKSGNMRPAVGALMQGDRK